MTPAEDIGDTIRAARRAHGLTQEQLAELAGASTRTIREVEKGSGGTSLDTVIAVAGVVGLRIGVIP